MNLFCCKNDKAAQLEDEGVIVQEWDHIEDNADSKLSDTFFSMFPFGSFFESYKASSEYIGVLNNYILSRSPGNKSRQRVGHLMTALEDMRKIVDQGENSIEKLTTLARLAFETGERAWGVKILTHLINRYHSNMDFEIHEPLLPACPRFDDILPNDKNIKEWLFSSIIEQYIEKHAFSTYFTRLATLPLLKQLSRLGFMTDDMQRRMEIMHRCFST